MALFIKGGKLFDPVEGVCKDNPGIYTAGKDIVSIGGEEPSEDLQVIDASDGYVMPGLINAHVHLVWDASADPDVPIAGKSDCYVTYVACKEAQKHLALGITTVRDTASIGDTVLSLRDAIKNDLVVGPNIVSSGQPIAMTGGHINRMALVADSPDAVRAMTRRNLHHKVDLIKLMATGGVYTEGEEPGSPQLTIEEMKVAVEEAHKRGKKVTVHAEGLEGIKNSLIAGTDGVEHFNYGDDEAIQMMVDRGVYLCPTIICFVRMTGQAAVDAGVPDWAIKKAEQVVEAQNISFPKAVKAGVKIITGTDAGAPLNTPEDYFVELQLMKDFGMGILDLLRSATCLAAEAIDLPTVGIIKEGNMADILILDADPTQSLENLRKVRHIIKGGKIVNL